jgi:hypothetical protein
VSWSDDGKAWTRHTLSTSYRSLCDGGAVGADLEILADRVVIGLWRADFTSNRGRTWRDVALPFRMVGANDGIGTPYDADCTHVDLMRDGRLHMSYFRHAVATDESATTFVRVARPSNAGRVNYRTYEGILVAPLRRQHGERVVSYDGAHWRPLRVRALLRHLFEQA